MRVDAKLRTSILIFILITAVDWALARFAVANWSIAPGVSALYFSVPFMIAFGLWFGWWGVGAAYIACILGAGLPAGIPLATNLYWSLADAWQVLIPVLAFWVLDADVGLSTRHDWFIFLAFGWMINNQLGAVWGSSMLALGSGKVEDWLKVPDVFLGWYAGNLLLTFIITPLLLKYVTPWLVRKGLTTKNLILIKEAAYGGHI